MTSAKQIQLRLERPPFLIHSGGSFHHRQTGHALATLKHTRQLASLKTLNNGNAIVPAMLYDSR